jgi:hypothetical protein
LLDHHLAEEFIEVTGNPPAMLDPVGGVLFTSAGSLHHAVKGYERQNNEFSHPGVSLSVANGQYGHPWFFVAAIAPHRVLV